MWLNSPSCDLLDQSSDQGICRTTNWNLWIKITETATQSIGDAGKERFNTA